jgi:hypothetical protein
MFCMLQIILGGDRISACVSVSCELEVFFRNMMRIAAYFDVWPVRFIGSRQRIGPSPIVRRPAAHPLVLTWSHFNFPTFIRLAESFSDRFRPKLSRIGCERDGSHLRVARLGRSRHARRADVTDRIDLDPLRISLYQRRPWPRSDHCPTFGRPSRRPPRLTLFRCFSNPSRDQIVRVGSGWKAEAAKFALPANPSRTE